MEQERKVKPVSVAESAKLSKEKIAKLKKLSKKLEAISPKSQTNTYSYHY